MLTPKEIAYEATKALDSKKGLDIQVLRVDRVTSLADYFIICTGSSRKNSFQAASSSARSLNPGKYSIFSDT